MNYVRILAIDPGQENTGISILDIAPNFNPHVLRSETLVSNSLIKQYKHLSEIHNERFVKQLALTTAVNGILTDYKPDLVISEDAYYNPSRHSAYGSLKELISVYRMLTFGFNQNIPFYTIAASTVKKELGVNGKDGDKNLMRIALAKYKVSYESSINIENLSEHAIDSIAIGLWASKNINVLLGLSDEMVIR